MSNEHFHGIHRNCELFENALIDFKIAELCMAQNADLLAAYNHLRMKIAIGFFVPWLCCCHEFNSTLNVLILNESNAPETSNSCNFLAN